MSNIPKLFICARRFCHAYKKTYVPSSKIAEQSVIYFDKGILALNKPYGISFSQDTIQSKENDPTEVSLTTILPFLKKKFGCENIYNVRVPEKYNSGVAVFCTTENLLKKLHGYLRIMRGEGIPSDLYEAVVVGTPVKEEFKFEGAIKLENSPHSAKAKRVALVPSYTKTECKRGKAKKIVIHHRTLARNNQISLVEVAASRNSWHCIRAYLSTVLLSPILGDDQYGACVKNILGQPVLIDKFSPVASLPQKLSPDLLKILKLTSKDIAVPLHLHLTKVTIRTNDKNDSCFTFIAPPPEMFTWTCKTLELASNHKIK